ncbi:MAG TPA: gas vesicle structural protein GvpA [Vulgatibacter sp.]|nr:gas vesicle structural protein GvpA [Vulgatibacter sp.]
MAQVKSQSNDSSSLAEVVDRILDKGIVVDAWVSVSLVGIELLSIRARVVIASVETYLKFAERIGETAAVAAPGEGKKQPQAEPEKKEAEAEAPTAV